MEGSRVSKLMLRPEGEQAESGAPSLELSISMVPGTPDELIGVPLVANDNHVGVVENSTLAQLVICNDEEREWSCHRERVRLQEAIVLAALMALQKGCSKGEFKSGNCGLIEIVEDVEKSMRGKEAIKERKGKERKSSHGPHGGRVAFRFFSGVRRIN
ncbi:hypothetical protein Ancab_005550 [Ancistrocladus abbreviatus]